MVNMNFLCFNKDTLMWFGILLLIISMRIISVPTSYLAFIFLMLYGLISLDNIIRAFFLSFIISLFNTALGPELPLGTFFRYGLVFFCFISVLLHSNRADLSKISKNSFFVLLIFLLIGFHSLFFSYYPIISFLKIFFWSLTFLICMHVWEKTNNFRNILNDLYFGLLFILLFSIPFVFIPEIGFSVNGTGFQGILNQPQAFGPVVGLFAIFVFLKIIFEKNIKYTHYFFILSSFIVIILSQARTAGLALIISIIFYSIFVRFKGYQINIINNTKGLIFTMLSMISFIFLFSYISNFIQGYIFKRDEASNLIDAASASRGGLVEKMILNIEQDPIFGIGFGIGSEIENMEVIRDKFFGIPISAAVEKGVLPIAIVEELGIIIGFLIFIWLFFLFLKALNNKSGLIFVFFIFLINLGESTLFSVGGLGLLFVLFLSFAISDKAKLYVS